MTNRSNAKQGYWKVVYCRYIKKNGRKIYPKKAKCFRFLVWVDTSK